MKGTYELRKLALICVLLLVPAILLAGGYLVVSSSGVPYKWDTTSSIPLDIDGGNFGILIGSAAVTFAENAIGVWADTSQPTLALSFITNSVGTLSADGDVDDVAEYNAIRNVIDGRSPVVFDEDGSLVSALGLPSGVIGFAAIEVIDTANNLIIETFQLYNGNFLDGDPNDAGELTQAEMRAVIIHEMGHALNFDHTQINGHYFIGDTDDPGFVQYGAPPSGAGVVNLMFPFSLSNGNDASTPNLDDLAVAETLYGNGTQSTSFISGTVFGTDGTTGIQGVNVIARDVNDPFFGAISNVSGLLSPAGAADGTYTLIGLRGTSYTVEIVNVNPNFTQGSSVGPVDPPLSVPIEEFFNGSNESENPLSDDPSAFTQENVNQSGVNVVLNLNIQKAAAGMSYASTGKADGGRLLTIDPSTGTGSLIGNTGFAAVPGLAINSTGDIFGTLFDDGSGAGGSHLIRIDAATGQGVIVGPITGFNFVEGIAFDANDVLYGLNFGGELLVISTTDASPTLVGNAGFDGWAGLAFDPTNGTLYASTGGTVRPDSIFTINPQTGVATFVGTTGLGGGTPDLHFDAAGNLFGSKGGGGGGGGNSSLKTTLGNNLIAIDKATGAGIVIGSIGFSAVSGLASRVFGLLDLSPPLTVDIDQNTLTVPLNLMNPNGVAIDNLGLTFKYPGSVLTFQNVDASGTLTAGWTSVNGVESTPGEISINALNVSPITSSGTLLNVVFQVEGAGTGLLDLENFSADIAAATTTSGILNSTVPVELASFTAEVLDTSIKLFWTTTSETNNFGFEIEKSLDLEIFSRIGFLNGAGTISTPRQYTFEDDKITPGTLSYRLKQIDSDGSFQYFGPISVQINFPKEFSLAQNYPNPFNPETRFHYELPFDSQVKISVYNLIGQRIRTLFEGRQKAGRHKLSWDGRTSEGIQAASGVYLVRMEAKKFVKVRKMVLAK